MSSGHRGRGQALADAATGLVGTPFRLGGRDPRIGLDCLGLLHASLVRIGHVPFDATGYRLRNVSIAGWLPLAQRNGFAEAEGIPMAGDVLLCRPGPGQHHIVIWQGAAGLDRAPLITQRVARFIHAHAGLRRIVAAPAPLPWPLAAHWRLPNQENDRWQP